MTDVIKIEKELKQLQAKRDKLSSALDDVDLHISELQSSLLNIHQVDIIGKMYVSCNTYINASFDINLYKVKSFNPKFNHYLVDSMIYDTAGGYDSFEQTMNMYDFLELKEISDEEYFKLVAVFSSVAENVKIFGEFENQFKTLLGINEE